MTKNFLYYIYLLTGFFVFFYIFYIRLIVIRLPKNLDFFVPTTNWVFIFIVIIWIVICIFIIYKNLQLYFEKEKKSMFSDIITKMSIFLDKSIYESFNLLAGLHPEPYDLIAKFAKIFYKIMCKFPLEILIWISGFVRLLVVCLFLFDIFYFFKFNFFYKSLILLVLPLIIKIIIYILREFSTNLYEIRSYLDITEGGLQPGTNYPIYLYSFKEEFKHYDDLNYYKDNFIICRNITEFLQDYDLYNSFYNIRINLVIYTLYFCGWFFIVYKNLLFL